MPLAFTRATPRAEWVMTGEACLSQAGMRGVVLRIAGAISLPYAVVRWENGSIGRSSLSTLSRALVRCESLSGFKRCSRDATTLVCVKAGDGSVESPCLCSQHANRMIALGSWRTDVGEDYRVIAHERIGAA